MELTKYTDQDTQFREIRSRSYNALRDLEAEYKKKGFKTWFNMYNGCEGIWMLTVKTND